jgi:orotate phosphoribosyltransferase
MNTSTFLKHPRLQQVADGQMPPGMAPEQYAKMRRLLGHDEPDPPSFSQRVKNYTRSTVRHARNGFAAASDEVQQQRLAICEACPTGCLRHSDGICSHPDCGCPVKEKVKRASEPCPEGHWAAVEVPLRKKRSAGAAANGSRRFRPMPFSRYRSAFRPATSKARFVTLEQFGRDIHRLAAMVPPDVTTVAGVSRSGMYPATMLAMLLHLPLLVVRHHQGDIIPGGNGWRLNEGAPTRQGRTLFVDDTTMTGNSLKRTKFIARENGYETPLFASVYVNPAAKAKPGLWSVDLPWPHLLEWNLFNSVLMDSCAFDMDGILCHDCPVSDDDDGERYLEWMRTVKPLYLVRKRRIRTIITARLEKYRPQTEEWLAQWRIRYDKLVMGPWKSKAERHGKVAQWKAKQVKKFAKSDAGRIKPTMYIESDPRLAKAIASASGVLTVCPATAECFGDPSRSGRRRTE